jgi:hypothetical protein
MLADGDVDRRNIGEEVARDIEEKLKLPPGWLDHDHAGEGRAAGGVESHPPVVDAEFWNSLSPATRGLVEDMMNKSAQGLLSEDNLKFIQELIDKMGRK